MASLYRAILAVMIINLILGVAATAHTNPESVDIRGFFENEYSRIRDSEDRINNEASEGIGGLLGGIWQLVENTVGSMLSISKFILEITARAILPLPLAVDENWTDIEILLREVLEMTRATLWILIGLQAWSWYKNKPKPGES